MGLKGLDCRRLDGYNGTALILPNSGDYPKDGLKSLEEKKQMVGICKYQTKEPVAGKEKDGGN